MTWYVHPEALPSGAAVLIFFSKTDYAPVHPGEGHNDIYLEDYDGKDVSKEFEYYHSKRDKPEPQKILQRVDEKGRYKKISKIYDH